MKVLAVGWLGILAVLAGMLADGRADRAPTRYAVIRVDPENRGGHCDDGRDRRAAQRPRTPVCSIARGLALARPGDRVELRGGRYPALAVSRGGADGRYVTVAARPGEAVTLPNIVVDGPASHLRFTGLRLTGGGEGCLVIGEDVHHVQLRRSVLTAAGTEGVLIRAGASHLLFAGNTIATPGASGGSGIAYLSQSRRPGSPPVSEPLAPISDVVIRDNRFLGDGTDAIRPANFRNLLVEGNEITGLTEAGEHADALQVVFGGDHLVFRRNYVHGNGTQGFFLKDGLTTDVTVEDNLFVQNALAGEAFAGYQIHVFGTEGLAVRNNTVWGNDGGVRLGEGTSDVRIENNILQDLTIDDHRDTVAEDHNLIGPAGSWTARGPHDVGGTPRFARPARGDWRLRARSPGIDAGTSVPSAGRDAVCRRPFDDPAVRNRGSGPRPFVDLGALERRPGRPARRPFAC